MSNEQYLIVSYFVVGLLSIGVGLGAYFYLRSPLEGIAEALTSRDLGGTLKRIFPAGVALSALSGFLSVSYKGCGGLSYEQIVAERAYLVAKNREQIVASLEYLVAAILAGAFVVAIALVTARSSSAPSTRHAQDAQSESEQKPPERQ